MERNILKVLLCGSIAMGMFAGGINGCDIIGSKASVLSAASANALNKSVNDYEPEFFEFYESTPHGDVTFYDANGLVIYEAREGDRVYFTTEPDEGYEYGRVAVINEDSLDEIKVKKESKGHYSFEMPAADISVNVLNFFRIPEYDLEEIKEGMTFACKLGQDYRFVPETDGIYEFRAGDTEKTDLVISCEGQRVQTNEFEYGNYCTLKAGKVYKFSMTVRGVDNESMIPPFFINKTTSHEVIVKDVEHGKVQVTYLHGRRPVVGEVDFDAEISLKFIPDKGYKLKKAYLSCYDTSTSINASHGLYALAMPNSDLTVKAIFEKTK